MISRPVLRCALAIVGVAAVVSGVAVAPAPAHPLAAESFHRVATYPVFANVPAGVDPAEPTVAEISAVTDDGRTVIYSDALGKRVGFVDITNPSRPVGRGTIDLAQVGDADDQPTSVAVVGEFLLVVIDTSGGNFADPSGRLDVFRIADRQRIRSIDLGGQPDSITISPDHRYAAIAIENQRDEDTTPPGREEGDLPQTPAGFVQVITLGRRPADWVTSPVPLTADDGSALPVMVAAGLDTPEDPEPEYVTINRDNQLAVTLQENNGIALIVVRSRKITKVFSAGTATITGIDTENDGLFDPTGSITAAREPDAIAWIGTTRLATANEGDWKGGTRGWTIFDARTGRVRWDAGNSFERIADQLGLHNEDRADNKGVEPEGITVSMIGGRLRAFVGSERSNFVAVYDLSNPDRPRYEQGLPTTNGPEGLVAIPARDLLVVSSEEDDASVNVRATVGLYRLERSSVDFPSVVSTPDRNGQPIGWGALGALSAVPGDPRHLYAASDAAYATGRIYTVDVARAPARIERVLTVRNADGTVPELDIEGLHARAGGGFWAAVEGATGAENRLVKITRSGLVERSLALPTTVSDHIGKWGLEGVTAVGRGRDEVVYVAIQRPLWNDPKDPGAGFVDGAGVTRIGRYEVRTGTWSWFGYRLQTTSTPGDWLGLSEITAVDRDTLAVVERDKLSGPAARVKRIYTVDLPKRQSTGKLPLLRKRLAIDLLPALRDTEGWTQEKLEGLTIGADRRVYAVTDNDGLADATGETVFLRLGSARSVFRH